MDTRLEGPLHFAVVFGTIGDVRDILKRDPSSVNDWNLFFKTPLDLICKDNLTVDKLPMIELLISYGANVNFHGHTNVQPVLHTAINANKIDMVRYLLENKADPNIMGYDNFTALHCALDARRENIVELLLEYNADPNIVDLSGKTALDRAVYLGVIKCAKILLEYGAKSKNIYKRLMAACTLRKKESQGDEPLVELLLSRAAEVDIHGKFSLLALMHYAHHSFSFHSHEDNEKCFLMDFLHSRGVRKYDVERFYGDLRGMEHEKWIRNFIKSGRVNDVDPFGKTPLHMVLTSPSSYYEHTFYEIVGALIDNGADVRASDCLNRSPLARVWTFPDKQNLIEMMLEKSTKVDYETNIKRSAPVNCPLLLRNRYEVQLLELEAAIDAGCRPSTIERLLDELEVTEANEHCSQTVNQLLDRAIYEKNSYALHLLFQAGLRSDRRFTRIVLNDRYGDPFKAMCLLWEYDGVTSYDATIITYKGGDSERIKLQYLFIFNYVIHERLNKLCVDLIPARGLFKLRRRFSKIPSICNDKLDELKDAAVTNEMSMYDIVTMPLDRVVRLLHDKKNFEACEKLSVSFEEKKGLRYYEHAIKFRVGLAIERVRTWNAARNIIDEALEGALATTSFERLPDEIMGNILSYLGFRELARITKIDDVVQVMYHVPLCSTVVTVPASTPARTGSFYEVLYGVFRELLSLLRLT